MAAFAWRSPPRSSRIWLVLPLDAGIGQKPHVFAKAASFLMRSGLSPIRTNIGDCHRRDAERRHQYRSPVGDHAVEPQRTASGLLETLLELGPLCMRNAHRGKDVTVAKFSVHGRHRSFWVTRERRRLHTLCHVQLASPKISEPADP